VAVFELVAEAELVGVAVELSVPLGVAVLEAEGLCRHGIRSRWLGVCVAVALGLSVSVTVGDELGVAVELELGVLV